jgi:eukaryotic-like serine/threonine-protein kinase
MTLSPGTRLGAYEVRSKLGQGGMGEVYRATDTKLGRDVALKVLPEELFEDRERVVTADGRVKLLDFGLARAFVADTGPDSSPAITQSPTLTAQATAAGVILGTAAYMSPEQARGKAVDKRTDVWAFGCVLYEMLTGRRPFEGETVSDTLAAVLRQEVNLAALPPATPASIRRVLARCLERDAKQRLRDIGEARIALDPEAREERTGSASEAPVPSWLRWLPWTLVVVLAAVSGAALWTRRGATKSASPIRFKVELTNDASVRLGGRCIGTNVVLSPAGDLLVFVAASEGSPIYARRLDDLAATPVPGTEGGSGPFFSPDGAWVAFFADGKLKKVALSGGAATVLADAEDNRGGAWLEDGTIVFAPRVESPLLRVAANGGPSVPMTTLDVEQRTHRWPDGLPGGRGLIHPERNTGGGPSTRILVINFFDELRRLAPVGVR